MEFPVDFLTASSHEDLEKAGQDFMSALLQSNPDKPECFKLPDSMQVPIGLSTVALIPLYGGNSRQKVLALFDPKDQSTAVALYLANQWWAVEDILKTANPFRKGLLEVRTLGERIVLYVLNKIVYRAHEIGTDEVPFLCHSKDDFVKVLWKDGKAIGFYSVKPKGSSCIDSLTQGCHLSVMDSMFVRKSYRGSQYGLQILEDFVQSFREGSLGIKYPLSTYMYKVCEEYLHMYPEDKDLLWEVRNVGGTYQKALIAHKIINVPLKGGVMQESSENTETVVEEKAHEKTVTNFMEEEVVIVTRHARVREAIRDTPVSSHSRTVDLRRKRLRERSEEVIEESAPDKINRMEYMEEIIEVPVEMFEDPERDGEESGQQGQVGQYLMQEEHWGGKLALEIELLENKEATINSDLLVSVSDTRKESSNDLTGLEEATIANMSTDETMEDEDIAEQEASCVQVAHKPMNLQEEAVEKQTPSKHTDLFIDWAEKTVEEPVGELLEGKMSPEEKDKDHSKSISQMKEPISVDACQIMLVSQEESSFKPHESDDVYQTASDFQKERKKLDEKEHEMGITENMEEAVTEQHEELKDNDEEKTEVMPHEMDTTRGMKKGHKRSTRAIMFRHLENDSHSLAVEKTASNTTEEKKASRKQPDETAVEVRVLSGNTKKIISETPKFKYSKIKVKALRKKTNIITDRVAVEEVKSKQQEKAENTEELMTVEDKVTTSIEQDIDVENIMDTEDDTPVLEKIVLCGKNKTATDEQETSMEIVEQEKGIKGTKMENTDKVTNEKENTQESKTEEEEEVEKDEILVVKPDEVELSTEEKDVVEERRKEDIEGSAAQTNVAEETIALEQRVLRKRSVKITKRKASPGRTPNLKSKRLRKQPVKDYKDDFQTTDGGEREEPKSIATEEEMEALTKNLNVGEESNTVGKTALRPRPQKLKSNPKVTPKRKSKRLSETLVQNLEGDLSVTDEEKEGNRTTTTEEEIEVSETNLNLEEEPATAEKRVLRKRSEKVKANTTSEVTPKCKSKPLKKQPIQEYKDYLSTMDEESIEEHCTRGNGQEKNDGSSEQRNLDGQKQSFVAKGMNKGEKKTVGDNHTEEKTEGKTLVNKTNEIAGDLDLFQEETDKEKDAMADKEETEEEMEVLTTDLSKVKELNSEGRRVLRKQTEKIKGKISLSATTKSKCLSKQTTEETKCSLPALDQDGEENIARGDGEKMKKGAEEESILQEDVLENNERSTSEKKLHKAGDEENMEKEVGDEQNAKQKATDVEKEEHYETEMQETDKAGTSIITVDETETLRSLSVAEESMVEERRREGLPEPNKEEEEEKEEEAIMEKGENKNMEEKNAEKKLEVSRAKKGVNNKEKAGEEGTKQERKKEVENEVVHIVGEVASEKKDSGEVQGGELVIRNEETKASEDSLNEAEVLTVDGQTVLRESEENITMATSISKSTQRNKGPLKEFKDNLPAEDNMANKSEQVKQKLEGEYEEVVTKEINLEAAMKDKLGKLGQSEKVEVCFLEENNKEEGTEKRVDETEKEVGENPIEEEGVKEHVGSITDKRVIAVDDNMEAVLGKHKNEYYVKKGEAAASQEAAAEEEAKVSETSTIEDKDDEPILLGMRVLRGKTKIFQITPRQHRKRVLKNDEEEENNEAEEQESCKEKVTTADEEHVKKSSAEAIMSPALKRKLPNRKYKITPPQHKS